LLKISKNVLSCIYPLRVLITRNEILYSCSRFTLGIQ